ncbi:MAG: phosphotransferase [Myxococcales bacterium]|nr:phosphotransferase [Myxococcales bacterium]
MRWLVGGVGAFVLLATLTYAVAFATNYVRPFTRHEASSWIYQNVPGPVNLVLNDEQLEPIPYPGPLVLDPGDPTELFFRNRSDGEVTSVYLPYVSGPSGAATSIRVSLSDDSGPLASGQYEGLLAADGESRIEVKLDRPVVIEADKDYSLRLEPGFDDFQVEQFEGGQSNPTFLLNADSGDYVLRKKPPGVLLPRAHMVEREYRILAALAATDVPVPKVHLLCESPDVVGTPFFIMDYVRGRLLREPTLPDMKPAERRAIYEEILRVLASLHAVDYEAIGLADYGKPGNYFGRQINRWSQQYEASKTREIASMDRLMKWLPENIPDDDTSCIVHGDYRLDNLVLAADEPRVSAILDWELSTLGHPLADLAHGCAHYYVSIANQPALVDTVGSGGMAGAACRDGVDGTAGGGSAGDATNADSGIPTEREYVEIYCRYTGRSGVPYWNFYLAFVIFRYACIAQGVYQRGLQGNASSQQAISLGSVVEIASDKAWEITQRPASDS